MDTALKFKKILKGKGTGKTMSKHLRSEDIAFVIHHLHSMDIPMAMKATLITAWIMLNKTDEEASALNHLREHLDDIVPKDLHFLMRPPHDFIDRQIEKLLNHEHLTSADLRKCLQMIIENTVPNFKIAALFEGLRLKEETFEENCTVYDFYREQTSRIHLPIPLLIDMATPYDGFNRHYFLQPFLAALLASVGIPSILHGVKEVSPKNGMNTHKLFLMANKNPLKPMANVKQDILSRHVGWGYVDQAIFCPDLHALIQTRIDMVKRPVLATIEKWLQPFSADRTICFTGFTHPPYKQKTIDMIEYTGIYDDLILVRGIEGSTLLPYDRRTPFILSQNHRSPVFDFMSPNNFGLTSNALDSQDPDHTLSAGLDALSGKNQTIANHLVYQSLAIGSVIGKDRDVLRDELYKSIDTGKALAHWEAAT
jgi:anthranilate phosphoribosyltransferase